MAEGKAARALLSRSRQGGLAPPWIPVFLRAEKGVGSSLYRLPNVCHAVSLIPALRFFRKEKSSLPDAGYSCAAPGFLRRAPRRFCAGAKNLYS